MNSLFNHEVEMQATHEHGKLSWSHLDFVAEEGINPTIGEWRNR